MKNVTITLDEKVAQWVRIWAAKHHSSVSRLVGELLEQRMREERGYETAMKQFLAARPVPLKSGGRYPARDELHDRKLLR
ncbi:MAG: CopG family transcriptional regulator [Gammaproteobacteria bacterium]|nr:MAG: CopG family transcriptional regulator [Gammaproteobacteria bacterium]